jgi:hypothetical protein
LKSIIALFVAVAAAHEAVAQTTPVGVNQGTYLETFNSLGTTTSAYPAGWMGYKVGGNGGLANNAFVTQSTTPAFLVSDGSDATGTVYNFGSTSSSDRALGTVANVTTIPGFGVVLVNNSNRILTAADVAVAFRVEQWRTGSANTVDEFLRFEFRTGSQTLDVNDPTAGWTQVSGLDIREIRTEATGAGPIDGNAPGNFTNVAGTLTGLVWNPGDRLVLRWVDSNDQGSDAGLAIDDFSLTVFAPVPEPNVCLLLPLFIAVVARRRSRRVNMDGRRAA